MTNDKSIKAANKHGTTLVEVAVTIIFLLLVVLAAAAFFYYSAGNINIASNKKIAVEIANARLEELRAADFDDIEPLGPYPSDTYLINQSGLWGKYAVDPNEIVALNGMDMPIKTKVKYADAINNYIHVNVSVGYRGEDSTEVVTFDTYIGPS